MPVVRPRSSRVVVIKLPVSAKLKVAARHRAVWPLLILALIFAVDGYISPGFFTVRVVEGRLFGNLIDILYRAMPTAMVALAPSPCSVRATKRLGSDQASAQPSEANVNSSTPAR